MTPPRVLTIAGSDPSGGAGLQADLKTLFALGAYGMAVVTAVTAQNTTGVASSLVLDAQLVDAQISAIAADCPPAATKTGMLGSADVCSAVAAWAGARSLGRLVVDPVMVATSGDGLLAEDALDSLRRELIPVCDLVTPNLLEAGALLGRPVTAGSAAVVAAHEMSERWGVAVLVKGGHAEGEEVLADVLVEAGGRLSTFSHERLPLPATHGTGCTLSAAIAARLAAGRPLRDAVEEAVAATQRGLRAAFAVGAGAIPVNHLALGGPFRAESEA